MKKVTLVVMLFMFSFLCAARTLVFDKNGNLVDPTLDKRYAIKRSYSLLITNQMTSLGYEINLREFKHVNFDAGLGFKFFYLSVNKPFIYRAVSVGLLSGWSWTTHKPVFGVGFTLRKF